MADEKLDDAQAALQAARAGLAASTPLPLANTFGALQNDGVGSDAEDLSGIVHEEGDMDPNARGPSK